MHRLVQPCAGVQKLHLPEGLQQVARCLPSSVKQQNKVETAHHVVGFLGSESHTWTQDAVTRFSLPFLVYCGTFKHDGNILHHSINFEDHVDLSLQLLQIDFKIARQLLWKSLQTLRVRLFYSDT